MDFPKSEIVGLIYQLMPGFVAAWCFFGLTAHQKSSPFERTIQALIFTGIVKAIVICFCYLLIRIGTLVGTVGEWSTEGEFVLSIVIGVIVGVLFSSGANNNWPHEVLPEWVSKRTAYPSEWFGTLSRSKRYVVLHLKGLTENRRILGWPYEWPDSPTTGHFVLVNAKWLLAGNKEIPIFPSEKILISATEVEMIEILEENYWPTPQNAPDEKSAVEAYAFQTEMMIRNTREQHGIEATNATTT